MIETFKTLNAAMPNFIFSFFKEVIPQKYAFLT